MFWEFTSWLNKDIDVKTLPNEHKPREFFQKNSWKLKIYRGEFRRQNIVSIFLKKTKEICLIGANQWELIYPTRSQTFWECIIWWNKDIDVITLPHEHKTKSIFPEKPWKLKIFGGELRRQNMVSIFLKKKRVNLFDWGESMRNDIPYSFLNFLRIHLMIK